MKTLVRHVADAIRRDQDCGGASILTDEEQAALDMAVTMPVNEHFTDEHRLALGGLSLQLGKARLSISGTISRHDEYWEHCANVAIAAYDEWLSERQTRTPHER